MVQTRFNRGWPRRGFALLWDTKVLSELASPQSVLSMRQFFAQRDDWDDELDTMVVSGFQGCLESLSAHDAQIWIETDVREAVLSFQDYYGGQAGLVFWLPSGRNRISMKSASETYHWKHRDAGSVGLPVGRLLFSGAESELVRLMNTDDPDADYDGKHWVGLHHPRIS